MNQIVLDKRPVIETDRFSLRPVQMADEALIAQYTADKRVANTTAQIPHPLPPGSTHSFLKRVIDEQSHVWALDATAQGGAALMGLIGLTPVAEGQSSLGYWVAPSFWNLGFASKAVETLINANPCRDKTFFASVFQDNPASARVLSRNGFDYLGDAESFCVARNGAVPTWTYSRKL